MTRTPALDSIARDVLAIKDNNGECFACGKKFGSGQPHKVFTNDPQMQWVGPECFKKIKAAGEIGYQPPLGGPRLFETIPPVNNPFTGTVRWTKKSKPRHKGW